MPFLPYYFSFIAYVRVLYSEVKYSEHETESQNEAEDPEEVFFFSEKNIPFILGKNEFTKCQLNYPECNNRIR